MAMKVQGGRMVATPTGFKDALQSRNQVIGLLQEAMTKAMEGGMPQPFVDAIIRAQKTVQSTRI